MTIKKLFVLLCCGLIFLSGCCCQNPLGGKHKDKALSINNYSITRDEFEQEFKDSTAGKIDTPESRKEFLNSLIDRKLILQYAQAEELDKETGFLKMIERFWEQSLLKISLDKKTKEISGKISVTDDEIKTAYEDKLKDGKIRDTYDIAYNRIKWELSRAKEMKLMSDWVADMRAKAHITIDENIIKKD